MGIVGIEMDKRVNYLAAKAWYYMMEDGSLVAESELSDYQEPEVN